MKGFWRILVGFGGFKRVFGGFTRVFEGLWSRVPLNFGSFRLIIMDRFKNDGLNFINNPKKFQINHYFYILDGMCFKVCSLFIVL